MARVLSLIALLLGLIQLPLYRGGNALWPPIILGLFVSLSLLLASFDTSNHDRGTSKPGWPLLGIGIWLTWLVWQGLQIIPLSRAQLLSMSSYSTGFHDAVSSAGGEALYSVSVSPSASLESLFLSLIYFLLYLTVAWHARHSGAARAMIWALFLLAFAEAFYGALNELADVSHAFLDAQNRHQNVATGTFANRNHFAAFCTLGFAAGLALMLGRRRRTIASLHWRAHLRNILETLSSSAVLIRIGLVGLVIGVVLSRSRMGNVALAIGISGYAFAWLITTQGRRGYLSGVLLFISIAIADVFVVSHQFGLEKVVERIESTDLKADIRSLGNTMSRELMQQSGPFGTGLGSYSVLSETVRPPELDSRFRFAHNDYFQFAIEAGWIGLSILCALLTVHLGYAIRALLSKRSHRRAIGAAVLMALVSGLLHATVEFNFRIPSYVAWFITLLALSAVRPSPHKH